jgi:replicative superfamily II helicase
MYNEKDSFVIAVLTQERLLRLLRKDPKISFDYVIVDEAHSLLGKGERDILLASVIVILEKRNSKTVFKFLTPFLNEARNLDIKYTNIKKQEFYVKEYIKSEKFFLFNTKNGLLQLYDQFMNEFYPVGSENNVDEISFIEKNSANKNIVYLNKPVDIESFSKKLSLVRSPINLTRVTKACEAISEYIHPQYSLIQCLKRGIIYHHGSVPDSVRLYIEHLYSNITEIKYVITSSTLLEGVNLPAERMFILDNKKGRRVLSPSNFKNLIGRVCRFGDIFNTCNTECLWP